MEGKKEAEKMSQLWTDKFFPKDLSEFLGNSDIVEKARSWGEKWVENKPQKPLLFFGPTGNGKTCLAVLLAKYFDWQLFEMNASDTRTKDIIERIAGSAALGSSFSGKKRLILLDEVDGLQGNADRGGVAAINRVIKESKNPVILTANDLYGNQKMLPFRSSCELLQFRKINYLSIAKRLREILEAEGVPFDPEAVKELAQNSAGDFRSALLDSQTLAISGAFDLAAVHTLGYRERQQDVFKTMGEVLKGQSVSEIRAARFKADIDSGMLFNWIEENIPRHFSKGLDNARAFERLSKADIFNGRIMRRQHYGFLRYSSELMTSGVSLSRQHEYSGWIPYQFPGLLRKLGSSKGLRNLRKELGQKVGSLTHSSSYAFLSKDLAFLKQSFLDKSLAVSLSAGLDLSEDEIAFLLDAKPSAKKVQRIFESAQDIRKKAFLEKRRAFSALEEKQPLEAESHPDQNQTRLF
jgi:replication factor C large subunit